MPDYRIAVLAKAIRVLDVIHRAPRPATLTEIALTAKISKNATFRILRTFQDAGYVERHEDRWCLGRGLLLMLEGGLESLVARWKKALEWDRTRREGNGKVESVGDGAQGDQAEERPAAAGVAGDGA